MPDSAKRGRGYGDPAENSSSEIKTWGAYDQYAQAYLEEAIAVRRILIAERKRNEELEAEIAKLRDQVAALSAELALLCGDNT